MHFLETHRTQISCAFCFLFAWVCVLCLVAICSSPRLKYRVLDIQPDAGVWYNSVVEDTTASSAFPRRSPCPVPLPLLLLQTSTYSLYRVEFVPALTAVLWCADHEESQPPLGRQLPFSCFVEHDAHHFLLTSSNGAIRSELASFESHRRAISPRWDTALSWPYIIRSCVQKMLVVVNGAGKG